MVWQVAWNTSVFKDIWLIGGANTLLFFFVINECIRASLTGFVFMVPIFWCVTFNTGSVRKIRLARRADTSSAQFLINESIRTPLALFCFWIPEVWLVTFYASAVIFIRPVQWANTFVDLLIVNEGCWAFFALFGLIVPEKGFIAGKTDLVSFIRCIDRTCTFSKRNIIDVRQRTGIARSSLFVPKIWRFAIDTGTIFVQKRCLLRARAFSLNFIISKSRWTKLTFSWCTVIIRSCWTLNALVSIPQRSIDWAVDASFSIGIKISVLVTALTFSGIGVPISWHVARNTELSCTVRQVWRTNALLFVRIKCYVWIVVFELRTGVYCDYKYEQKKDMAFLIHITYQFILSPFHY